MRQVSFVVALFCAVAFLFGCGKDDDKGVDPPVPPPFGTVTGTITLPASASGKTLIAILDSDANKDNEPDVLRSLVCDSDLQYGYDWDSIPNGTYYLYALVYMSGATGGPPQSGDLFAYYGTGLSEPASKNVVISGGQATTCNVTLLVMP